MGKLKTKHAINNAHIIVIKGLFNLTAKDISELTGYSARSINNWLGSPEFDNYRRAPDDAVKKLLSKYSTELY